MAHKADEFIDRDQMARCDAFLRRLGQWILSNTAMVNSSLRV